MIHTEYLIIGQGICGTFLAWELEKAGRPFMMIDDVRLSTASKVASGIINPVTGRRIVKTWMIEELLPFAVNSYQEIEKELGIRCIQQKNVIDFFPTLQMKDAFMKRYQENPEYLHHIENDSEWRPFLNFDFGCGEINPCYLVDLSAILTAFRTKWLGTGKLVEGYVHPAEFQPKSTLKIQDIEYENIIFCDGIGSSENSLFKNLPFALNKGEALITEISGLQDHHIIKQGNMIVPWKDGLFWVGSSHEWNFDHDQPTSSFYQRTEKFLQHFLKVPFKIVEHLAAVRPATLERRPFLGMHPVHSNTGIFNGMGTKGCSLAPYFARHFVSHLVHNEPLIPEVDINRFKGILSRQ